MRLFQAAVAASGDFAIGVWMPHFFDLQTTYPDQYGAPIADLPRFAVCNRALPPQNGHGLSSVIVQPFKRSAIAARRRASCLLLALCRARRKSRSAAILAISGYALAMRRRSRHACHFMMIRRMFISHPHLLAAARSRNRVRLALLCAMLICCVLCCQFANNVEYRAPFYMAYRGIHLFRFYS